MAPESIFEVYKGEGTWTNTTELWALEKVAINGKRMEFSGKRAFK